MMMLANWTTREKRLLAIALAGVVLIGLLTLFFYKGSLLGEKTATEPVATTTDSSSTKSGGDVDETGGTDGVNDNGQSTTSGSPATSSSSNESTAPPAGSSSGNSASVPAQPVLTTVTNSKSFAAVAYDSVAVTCPAGTIAVGGGFRGAESTKFFASYLTNNGWYVRAVNGTLSSSIVFVYAQCLDNVPGSVTVSTNTTTITATASGTISRECSGSATVISGGYDNTQNGVAITFSNRVNNGWRVNATSDAFANQTLKVLTNCYSGGSVSVAQELETAEVPAGWTWTKAKACDSGLALMGGFASQAEAYTSYFNVNNSKWTTVVINRTDEPTNFKAYFYCATF